jgi:16S rRNA (adenine1518-N6/adenine1519-N6)-dimethyltransferase
MSRPRAKRRFGQHFLESSWAQKVVTAIEPAPGDVFVEVGPGTGALTFPLAATGAPILAIELDRDLASRLAARVPGNVSVLSGDFLKMDWLPFLSGLEPQRLPGGLDPPRRRFRAVGNLPYNLSSPILFHLIDLHRHQRAFFVDATVMLQREVADRLVAKPGTKAYGALSVLAQMHARIDRRLDLPPGAFRPPPKVYSSVVRITFVPAQADVPDERAFDGLVKALFSQRRKTLANALKRYNSRLGPAVLQESGFDGRRRPETLQVTEIARLAQLFATANRPPVV